MKKRDEPRPVPQLRFTAIAAGLFLAVFVGLTILTVAQAAGAPAIGIVAPIIGCACGGYLAGKVAKSAGLYHGAFTGAGWIALEAFGAVPTVAGAGLATIQETVAIIVVDVLVIGAAMAGGYVARRD